MLNGDSSALSFDCLSLSFSFWSVNLTFQRVGWNFFFLIFANIHFCWASNIFFSWAVCSYEKSFLWESPVYFVVICTKIIFVTYHILGNIITHPSVVWWIFTASQFFLVIISRIHSTYLLCVPIFFYWVVIFGTVNFQVLYYKAFSSATTRKFLKKTKVDFFRIYDYEFLPLHSLFFYALAKEKMKCLKKRGYSWPRIKGSFSYRYNIVLQ